MLKYRLIFINLIGLLLFSCTNNATFKDSSGSYVRVTTVRDSVITETNNVSYSEEYLNHHELSNYIVKKTQKVIKHRGEEGQNSEIKIDIFNITDSKKINSFELQADDIKFFTDFYQTTKFGCCGAEDYFELKSLWENTVFLRYNSRYYTIELPNERVNFYFGYLSDAKNEKSQVLGELYFSHSIPNLEKKGNIGSYDCKIINKVIFKTRSREKFKEIESILPEMTLVKYGKKDELIDLPNYQLLRLRSCDNLQLMKGINLIGLKLKFQDDEIGQIYQIEIPVKCGCLYGDKDTFEKIIYVDEK